MPHKDRQDTRVSSCRVVGSVRPEPRNDVQKSVSICHISSHLLRPAKLKITAITSPTMRATHSIAISWRVESTMKLSMYSSDSTALQCAAELMSSVIKGCRMLILITS